MTIIEHSETTTVNQGPTQLQVAAEVVEANSPVVILRGMLFCRVCVCVRTCVRACVRACLLALSRHEPAPPQSGMRLYLSSKRTAKTRISMH